MRRRLVIVALAAFELLAFALAKYALREPVTPENVARVRVGMSDAKLFELLGRPWYETKELGKVVGERYLTSPGSSPAELRKRGFRELVRRQWTSREAGVVVVSDLAGNVVCRYDAQPRSRGSLLNDWLGWML